MENYKGTGNGLLRDTKNYPFESIEEMEQWYGLQPIEKCWRHEQQFGKDNTDPITYEKLFSYDDITKAMQGESNKTYAFQRVLYKLQTMIEKKEI